MWQVSTDRYWKDAITCRTYKRSNIIRHSEVSLLRQSFPWTRFVPLNSNINHMLRHSDSQQNFCIIKQTRSTNFSNLFLELNSTCFGQFLCPSAFAPAHKLSANLYDIYHCCVYSEKTPDDGQRNCLKHVEFHSKNKFEKLVHLVGFIIRIRHDARSHERKKKLICLQSLSPVTIIITFVVALTELVQYVKTLLC